MALDCDEIYNGIDRDCEDSIGGLKGLWFINRNSIINVEFDENSPCLITAMTLAEGTGFARYAIQRQTSSFNTSVSYDIANGTKDYQTTLTAVFKAMTAEKNCELQKFTSGTAVSIAKDENNRFWLLGVDDNDDDYALEMGDGTTAGTGTARADLNGYTLNLIHYTNHYPYQIAESVIDSLGLYGGTASGTAAKVAAVASAPVIPAIDEQDEALNEPAAEKTKAVKVKKAKEETAE